MLERLGTPVGLSLGVLLILPAALGGFVIVYPLAAARSILRTEVKPLDIFPMALIFSYLAVVILAPSAPSSDLFTEYQQRPFVPVYMTLAVFTAAHLVRLIPWRLPAGLRSLANVGLMPLVTAATLVILVLTGFNPSRPRSALGEASYDAPVAPSIVDLADYIRRHARVADVVATGPVNAGKGSMVDFAMQLASIGNRWVYLSREGADASTWEASLQPIIQDRTRHLEDVEASPTLCAAAAKLQQLGVDWYVFTGTQGPGFDPTFSGAAFRAPAGAVYHVQPCPM